MERRNLKTFYGACKSDIGSMFLYRGVRGDGARQGQEEGLKKGVKFEGDFEAVAGQ